MVRGSLRFLFKGHTGGFEGVGLRGYRRDRERDDLSTVAGRLDRGLVHCGVFRSPEAEEVTNFLLRGSGRDARDVNGCMVRHDQRGIIVVGG